MYSKNADWYSVPYAKPSPEVVNTMPSAPAAILLPKRSGLFLLVPVIGSASRSTSPLNPSNR